MIIKKGDILYFGPGTAPITVYSASKSKIKCRYFNDEGAHLYTYKLDQLRIFGNERFVLNSKSRKLRIFYTKEWPTA